MESIATITTVDSNEELYDELRENDYAPNGVTLDMIDRIVEIARHRTTHRAENPLDQIGEKDFLFVSSWDNMVEERFGTDSDGHVNYFGLGDVNGRNENGFFVEEAVAIQWNWSRTGKDKFQSVKPVDLTHTEYQSEVGKMFWPKDYSVVIGFADQMVCDPPKIGDAF